jgi:hypothetical protein
LVSNGKDIVLVKMTSSIIALRITQSGVELVHEFKSSSAAGAATDDTLSYIVAAGNDKLEVVDVSTGRSQVTNLPSLSEHGSITQVSVTYFVPHM